MKQFFSTNGNHGIETKSHIFDKNGNSWYKSGNMLMNSATGETKYVCPQYGNKKQGFITDSKGNVDRFFKF